MDIKSSRSQKCWVDGVWPVGGSQHKDPLHGKTLFSGTCFKDQCAQKTQISISMQRGACKGHWGTSACKVTFCQLHSIHLCQQRGQQPQAGP